LRSYYVRELASRLEISEEAVLEKVSRAWPVLDEREDSYRQFSHKQKKDRRQVLLDYLFSVCFQEGRYEELLDQGWRELIDNPGLERLVEKLGQYLADHDRFESQEFAKELPEELVEIFNNFFVYPLPQRLADPQFQDKEIGRIKEELRLLGLGEKRKRLSAQISRAEKKGQDEKIEKLFDEIDKIDRQMKQLQEGVVK